MQYCTFYVYEQIPTYNTQNLMFFNGSDIEFIHNCIFTLTDE